eukprot:CAMPEP_0184481950 /NCGR_PEP_ID=MMETSP0113_2-20130426/3542_1 /TAXON_ID=91329 /ORGANISM="Norrisiella sphaerica, Strain BC52" /LENGTH=424 /DNA_ID=CAMNT_0026861433 /DNA_START=132 /DNA_END=1406 /DNA_ORIENTATION=+
MQPHLVEDPFMVNFVELFNAKGEDNRPRWPKGIKEPDLKVFVYDDPEINWVRMMISGECDTSFIKRYFLTAKHSADLHVALASSSMEFKNSSWYTSDPLEADVLLVPALLSAFSEKESRFTCRGMQKETLLDNLIKKLVVMPHYNVTAKKHMFIADHFAARSDRFTPAVLAVLQRSIVATFEGRDRGIARCTVTPPYVAVDCLTSNSIGINSMSESWGLKAEKKYLFSFRGQIDTLPHYEHRRYTCDVLSNWAKTFQQSNLDLNLTNRKLNLTNVCCSVSEQNNAYLDMCDSATGKMVKCNCKRELVAYCDELLQSNFVLYVGGDTPVSTRAYDALRHGTFVTRMGKKDVHSQFMPANVPWKDLIIHPRTRYPRTFIKTLALSADELERRKKLMYEYSAVMDWNAHGSIPALKFLIMNAVQKCG